MTGLYPRGVVVGVDGSHGSNAALTFAVREAALRGGSLGVVTAWTCATDLLAVDQRREGARQHAQDIQDEAIALTLSEVDARPVLSRQVVEGEAGEVLRRAAEDAAYLVLGATDDVPAGPTLFGTVGDYCLRHATCAVVVVRDPREAVDVSDD
jgi:nucleotide-binding universal stress UspA family protein